MLMLIFPSPLPITEFRINKHGNSDSNFVQYDPHHGQANKGLKIHGQ